MSEIVELLIGISGFITGIVTTVKIYHSKVNHIEKTVLQKMDKDVCNALHDHINQTLSLLRSDIETLDNKIDKRFDELILIFKNNNLKNI